MKNKFEAIMKAVIGGAGAGYAFSGGLSFLPAITITAGVAYSFAVAGSVILAGLCLKKMVSG
jgi:hypothetical protein